MEQWCSIDGYDNYEVSVDGRIRNSKTGRVLKPGVKSNGYEIVVLSKDGNKKTKLVHQLVANTFCEGAEDHLVIDHIDGDKLNNNASNLEFCTSGVNNARAYAIGLKKAAYPYNQPTCRKVRIIETGEEFNSIKECARHINGNHRHIGDCLNGKLISHHGYHYEAI